VGAQAMEEAIAAGGCLSCCAPRSGRFFRILPIGVDLSLGGFVGFVRIFHIRIGGRCSPVSTLTVWEGGVGGGGHLVQVVKMNGERIFLGR